MAQVDTDTPIVLNGNTYSSVISILSSMVFHSFPVVKPSLLSENICQRSRRAQGTVLAST